MLTAGPGRSQSAPARAAVAGTRVGRFHAAPFSAQVFPGPAEKLPMDDDSAFAPRTVSKTSETLESVAARMKPMQRVDGNLYRVVEVMRASNGRLTRVGQIWHSDLDRVRRFGRVLAANSVAEHVHVADASGAVVEDIPVPPPGTAPAGWNAWRSAALPPAPPRSARPAQKIVPGPKLPPTVVPPIIPQALPASLAPAAPKPTAGLPVMAPENAVERTSPLPPSRT